MLMLSFTSLCLLHALGGKSWLLGKSTPAPPSSLVSAAVGISMHMNKDGLSRPFLHIQTCGPDLITSYSLCLLMVVVYNMSIRHSPAFLISQYPLSFLSTILIDIHFPLDFSFNLINVFYPFNPSTLAKKVYFFVCFLMILSFLL